METVMTIANNLTYDRTKLLLEIVTSYPHKGFTYRLTWLNLYREVTESFMYTSRVALDMNTLHSIAVKAHKLVYEANETQLTTPLRQLFCEEEMRVSQSQNKPGE